MHVPPDLQDGFRSRRIGIVMSQTGEEGYMFIFCPERREENGRDGAI